MKPPTRSVSWQDLPVSILFSGTFANHCSNNNNNNKKKNNKKNKNKKTCVVALLYVDSHFVDNIMILHGAPQSQPTARQSHMGPKIMGFAEAKPTNERGDMLPLMANMGVSKDYRFLYIPNLCIPQNRKFNGEMILY